MSASYGKKFSEYMLILLMKKNPKTYFCGVIEPLSCWVTCKLHIFIPLVKVKTVI